MITCITCFTSSTSQTGYTGCIVHLYLEYIACVHVYYIVEYSVVVSVVMLVLYTETLFNALLDINE